MRDTVRIGFAGTDARTLLSALVVSTARSEHFESRCTGAVVRGTSAMPRFAADMDWPVEFFSTRDNSPEAYAETIRGALDRGELDYVLPMPEGLLFGGLIDELDRAGHGSRVAGLTSEASFIESDKGACKELCRSAGIPVADEWTVVDARSYGEVLAVCLDYMHKHGGAVLKYPYSAGGKGARVVLNTWEIREVYDTLMADYKKDYKKAFRGGRWPLLIESRMSGAEISFTILVDAEGHFQLLPTSMDYPERFEGAAGKENPITGGMGSISPHPLESAELFRLVEESIARPLISAMRQRNLLRPCVLYPGCFVSFRAGAGGGLEPTAVRVCEINIRPGEPEFQPIARRLCNLGPLAEAMFTGNLHEVAPEVREQQISLCVALVAGPGGPDGQRGYPWSVTKLEPVEVDHAYMQKKNIQVVPSGMGYSEERGLYSDGTRVAYLNVNGTVKSGESRGEVAERLRARLVNAVDQGKIRVVPRENPQGNRLDVRRDVGAHFRIAEELLPAPE
jgi:phosphoribosylamine--glycine ligase